MSDTEYDPAEREPMVVTCPSCGKPTPIHLTPFGFEQALINEGRVVMDCAECGVEFEAIVGVTDYQLL